MTLRAFERAFARTGKPEIDVAITRVVDAVGRALEPLLRIPFLDGVALYDIQLSSGSNAIPHKLDRKVRGFWVFDRNGTATVYRSANSTDDRLVTLVASGAVRVSVWVF